MTQNAEQIARRAAAAAARATMGRGRTDSDVGNLIQRFGMHADGYLHARVMVSGQQFYFHRRYGSWLAPGEVGGRTVLKEPEALLGTTLGREVKFALSKMSRPYDQEARRKREQEEQTDDQHRDSAPAQDGGGNDEAVRDAGVRVGADHPDAHDEVPDDGQ